jgi:hypothetical protein
VVFVSGNSFKREPPGQTFWPDLYQVLGQADVLSLSREEWGQLSDRWGTEWANRLFESHRTAMVAMHSPSGAELVGAPRLAARLDEPEALLRLARARASEYAARALTGLGARFDGVLSVLIASRWREGADSELR